MRANTRTADEKTIALADEAAKVIEEAAEPKTLFRIFDCDVTENSVTVDSVVFESSRLAQNLKGCKRVILFGATLGTEVDRRIKLASFTDTAKTSAYHAAGAALIEDVCDELEEKIKAELGVSLRQRYSPGYFDLKIEEQAKFFTLLELTKRIGLTLTDSYLMVPSKSVTAFIGIEGNDD